MEPMGNQNKALYYSCIGSLDAALQQCKRCVSLRNNFTIGNTVKLLEGMLLHLPTYGASSTPSTRRALQHPPRFRRSSHALCNPIQVKLKTPPLVSIVILFFGLNG